MPSRLRRKGFLNSVKSHKDLWFLYSSGLGFSLLKLEELCKSLDLPPASGLVTPRVPKSPWPLIFLGPHLGSPCKSLNQIHQAEPKILTILCQLEPSAGDLAAHMWYLLLRGPRVCQAPYLFLASSGHSLLHGLTALTVCSALSTMSCKVLLNSPQCMGYFPK